MPNPTIYNTGTASINAGATGVTGVGTLWASTIKVGSDFYIGGSIGLVATVNSDTSLTLASPWAGTTQSGQAYSIKVPAGDSAELSFQVRSLIEAIKARGIASILNTATVLTGAPRNTVPGSPATGDRYIVDTSPSGAWAGQAGKFAEWNGSAWVFTAPTALAYAVVRSSGAAYIYDSTWFAVGGSAGTDLSATHGASSVVIASNTGADATLNAATGSAAGVLTAADKTKLDGIATGATANSADATLLARANHTGTQLANTISDFAEATDDRVAALLVAGVGIGLSYNDAGNALTITNAALKARITADVTVTAAEAQVVGFTIPANTLTAGSTWRVKGSGRTTQPSNSSFNADFRVRIGATTLTGAVAARTTLATGTTARTAAGFDVDFTVTFRTVGATGAAIGAGVTNQSLAVNLSNANTATVTVDTTASLLLELTGSSSDNANSFTFSVATIEQLS